MEKSVNECVVEILDPTPKTIIYATSCLGSYRVEKIEDTPLRQVLCKRGLIPAWRIFECNTFIIWIWNKLALSFFFFSFFRESNKPLNLRLIFICSYYGLSKVLKSHTSWCQKSHTPIMDVNMWIFKSWMLLFIVYIML